MELISRILDGSIPESLRASLPPSRMFGPRVTQDDKIARLEEVVPEYVRATTDRFHMGRKTGIAIRYVEGETANDKEGNVLYNNIVPSGGLFPISYGINADVCAATDAANEGRFALTGNMNVYGGPSTTSKVRFSVENAALMRRTQPSSSPAR